MTCARLKEAPSMQRRVLVRLSTTLGAMALVLIAGTSSAENPGQFGTPKGNEGTRIFKAAEHPFYTGQFRLRGQKTTLVGGMQDQSPWDHLDYAGKRLTAVQGAIDIDVNEISNTGKVIAEFTEGSDRYKIVFDRFSASKPYQDGGIATRVYEHGDSGNGDPLYPNLGIPYAVTAVIMVLNSWHSDKTSERRGHVAAVYVLSGTSLILSVYLKQHFWLSYALMCLAIPGPFAALAPFWSNASETFPRSLFGLVVGLVNRGTRLVWR